MDGNGNGSLHGLPRHEVRRLVSEEALGRIDQLETKYDVLKAMSNRHASAMEAIANAITSLTASQDRLRQEMFAELAMLRWLHRPWYHRRVVVPARVWLHTVSVACDRWLRQQRDNVVSFRRLPPEE